jgi:hypothetical protein
MGSLPLWTVYDRPPGFLHSYVARQFETWGVPEAVPTGEMIISADLAALRHLLQTRGLTCIGRYAEDHPTIIESWI